jgi:hypothetical protein
MLTAGTLGAVLILAAGQAAGAPQTSADVVAVTLERGSIADGLETYFVRLKVAKGWRVFAGAAKADAARRSAAVVEFFLNGKTAFTADIYYPEGAARPDDARAGRRVYEGTVSFTGWLDYLDAWDAAVVSVRLTLTATEGKTRLARSVVTAEVR